MSSRQKLPVGIQTFAKIREDDCYYVGKTPFMLRLIDQGSHYFLSWSRRFGKSLLLDTIAEPEVAREMRDGLRNLYSVSHCGLCGDLRLYRRGCRYRLRAGTARTGSGTNPALVQRLQLDRHADLPGRAAGRAPDFHAEFKSVELVP